MNKIFSSLGKGIIYICTLPITLAILAIYSFIGIIMFFVVGIKGLILFFSGRNIFGDLPEDIEAKRRLNAIKMEHQAVETPASPTVVEIVNPEPKIEIDHNPYITTPVPEITPIENHLNDLIDYEEPKAIESSPDIEPPLLDDIEGIDKINDVSFLDDVPAIEEESNKDQFTENNDVNNEILEEPEEIKEEIIGTYKPLGTFNDDEYKDNGGTN